MTCRVFQNMYYKLTLYICISKSKALGTFVSRTFLFIFAFFTKVYKFVVRSLKPSVWQLLHGIEEILMLVKKLLIVITCLNDIYWEYGNINVSIFSLNLKYLFNLVLTLTINFNFFGSSREIVKVKEGSSLTLECKS